MDAHAPTSRARLTEAAARLFQVKGYHGTSVAEVLAEAGLPKGSLYHHFPQGKADLARAAAALASDMMRDIVGAAFEPAESPGHGVARLCEKFARLFERQPHWRACPVQALLDGPLDRMSAEAHLQAWLAATAAHLDRLGDPAPDARARRLWTLLIGAWTMARAADDPGALRAVPAMMESADA
ncbi:TetR/AcrR family transcriptional regulator [Jannaschia ovalis]|uniref:Helix-turn-helix domain containing protein n=1 Tax=Jannaschia ovalis TaxID=3038773 RepID=A0ABY8LDW5_9RHOB|nr:helix-turn-helix domain-containing protein [Jannaschia sp. GRR-S6-38]WGH79491.1 helix-turn-helix domain containing protein [Jannaschia sp. GRR-S6-38]